MQFLRRAGVAISNSVLEHCFDEKFPYTTPRMDQVAVKYGDAGGRRPHDRAQDGRRFVDNRRAG